MQTNLHALNDREARTKALANTMFEMHAEGRDVTDVLLLGEGFSEFELLTLLPAARQLANIRFVRQVEAEGFTRTDDALLAIAVPEASGLISEAAIHAHLRAMGFTNDSLARIWKKLMARLATSLAGRPMPQVA